MRFAKPKSLRAARHLKEKTRIWPGCIGGRKLLYTSPRTFMEEDIRVQEGYMRGLTRSSLN